MAFFSKDIKKKEKQTKKNDHTLFYCTLISFVLK